MAKRMALGRSMSMSAALAVLLLGSVACATAGGPAVPQPPAPPSTAPSPTPAQSYVLPIAGSWDLPADSPTGRVPSSPGTIEIEGLGAFSFDPGDIQTTRPDIFAPGHFSVFDVVQYLGAKEWFTLDYHYKDCLATHVIDELDGRMNWWYRAYYSGGWSEINAFRMDMLPYKDGMTIKLSTHPEEYMGRIYNSFAEELLRKSVNLGRVVIPEVRIGTVVHKNVPVSAHDFRDDVLQPGTITALDVLLSLADQNKIDRLKLSWYSDCGDASHTDSLRVEQIDDGDGIYDDEASDSGRWVYETGSREFSGFRGSHICVASDIRVIVSPEYMTWYWLDSSN